VQPIDKPIICCYNKSREKKNPDAALAGYIGESVRSIFLRLAAADSEIRKIDIHLSIETVFQDIANARVNGVLKSKRCAKSYECTFSIARIGRTVNAGGPNSHRE
jgi:hypothetical protein